MSRIEYIKKIKWSEISIERIHNAIAGRLKDLPHRIVWDLNTKKAIENKEKLKIFFNIHKNERCFIIANGPSLKNTDLTLLKNEFTIGMNRIYLNEESMGFLPTYLVVTDIKVQLEQFKDDLDKLKIDKFFNWNARKFFTPSESLTFIRSDYKPRFSKDLTEGLWAGHSVTYTCIQLAYYMGFKEVILIGKDHDYKEKGVPGSLVYASGDEDNHYIKGYYKRGMVWRIPDYKGEELAYSMAKKAFEEDNRRILDATVDGKLDIFEKVDYYNLF